MYVYSIIYYYDLLLSLIIIQWPDPGEILQVFYMELRCMSIYLCGERNGQKQKYYNMLTQTQNCYFQNKLSVSKLICGKPETLSVGLGATITYEHANYNNMHTICIKSCELIYQIGIQ